MLMPIGMHVKILAEGDDLEDAEEYDLTGSTEADMDLNRISDCLLYTSRRPAGGQSS